MTDTEIMKLAAKTYKQGWTAKRKETCNEYKQECCVLGAAAIAKGVAIDKVERMDFSEFLRRPQSFVNGVINGFDGEDVDADTYEYIGSQSAAFKRGYALGEKAAKKFVK